MNNHASAFGQFHQVQTPLTRLFFSSFCLSTARSKAARNWARITVGACGPKTKTQSEWKKRKETKWILLFVLTMGNYEERFYLYKQRVGEKGQLPQCSSTQAFAFSTDAERRAMSRWLSACARRHGHTHTCPHVTSGFTHRAMFLRYRLCSDTSLLANPIVSNSKMVNSCSRG